MALDPSLQEQQLVEAALKRRFTPLHARERRAEALLGGGFALACALVALAAPPWDAAIDPAAALFSALTLALAARVHFIVGPGYTVPTQLAFIPLAFAIPPACLAPAVASIFAAVQLADVLLGRLPLSRVALDDQTVNGAERRGAFPETVAALRAAAPTIAFGRPYTPDFVGWLDDFSTTGGYDAVGGYSRAWINLSELLYGPGPKTGQFRRCPGANELPAADGTNVLSSAEAAALDCDPSQRSVGP